MATLLIRKLDEDLKQALRNRAARNKRSMEEEARAILRKSLQARPDEAVHLVDVAREIVRRTGGFEIELPPREMGRDPPTFD